MNRAPEYDYLLKLVLIGDAAVGKSSLLLRYVEDSFDESYICTIGVDFKIKSLMVDGKSVKLQIWDTAGQERFKPITSCYFRGSHGCLATFDVTNRESFRNIEKWVEDYRENNDIESGFNIMIIGNKIDLEEERVVAEEEGRSLAERLGCLYAEGSAKTAENLHEVFLELSKEIVVKMKPEMLENRDAGVYRSVRGSSLIPFEEETQKRTCCK